jgi:predicted nucleotidyltransferase
MYHYLNMAKGNFRDYLQGEQVKIKKYFYVLRPLLACGWIERYETMPPMAFDKLVETLVREDKSLYTEIHDLLRRKKAGDELDMEPQLPAIQAYITAQIAHVEQLAAEIQGQATVEVEVLNRIFQSAVQEVWQ